MKRTSIIIYNYFWNEMQRPLWETLSGVSKDDQYNKIKRYTESVLPIIRQSEDIQKKL